LGLTHAFVSLCMLIAYYNLKVPLALFKREKEVARRLEFDGLYLSEQEWISRISVSAKKFFSKFMDKFSLPRKIHFTKWIKFLYVMTFKRHVCIKSSNSKFKSAPFKMLTVNCGRN
jgi:hypothetical protein